METSLCDCGWDHLKQVEGLRLHAYPDTGGVWTIGYGHTRRVKQGDRCTPAQAESWLAQDIEIAVRDVETYVHVPLNENQHAALVSFVYNVGADNFASSTLVRVLNQGEYSLVPIQLSQWVYVKHHFCKGLERRRELESELWNTPV